jgi:hypothetical protein
MAITLYGDSVSDSSSQDIFTFFIPGENYMKEVSGVCSLRIKKNMNESDEYWYLG